MTASAEIILSGRISNTPTGHTLVGPLVATSANANGQRIHVTLASGTNTITVPTVPRPTGVIVKFPDDNTAEMWFDTALGMGLTKTGFLVFMFDTASLAPVTSFRLVAGATHTKPSEITFF